jgi:hypothetical protein
MLVCRGGESSAGKKEFGFMSYIKACLHCPKIGKSDYAAGLPLSANPYKIGTYCARLWADGWLSAWMNP